MEQYEFKLRDKRQNAGRDKMQDKWTDECKLSQSEKGECLISSAVLTYTHVFVFS